MADKVFKRWNGSAWETFKFQAFDSDKLGGVLPSGYALSNHTHAEYGPTEMITNSSSFTLGETHTNKFILATSSVNRTITIPHSSTYDFPLNTEIHIVRYGTGELTISPASNVVLRSVNSKTKINAQYQAVTLKKLYTNT